MAILVSIKKAPYQVLIAKHRAKPNALANPHPVGVLCPTCKQHHNAAGAVAAFKADFEKRIQTDSLFRTAIQRLRGKTLGCDCHYVSVDNEIAFCHGQVFIDYLEANTTCRMN